MFALVALLVGCVAVASSAGRDAMAAMDPTAESKPEGLRAPSQEAFELWKKTVAGASQSVTTTAASASTTTAAAAPAAEKGTPEDDVAGHVRARVALRTGGGAKTCDLGAIYGKAQTAGRSFSGRQDDVELSCTNAAPADVNACLLEQFLVTEVDKMMKRSDNVTIQREVVNNWLNKNSKAKAIGYMQGAFLIQEGRGGGRGNGGRVCLHGLWV